MSMTQEAQTQFQLQMEEWLDFAWANRNNPEFKTPQTARWLSKREGGATSPLGSQASQNKTNVPTGTKSKNIINTHALYRAWKAQSTVIKKSSRKSCFLQYTEAIPEMHIFFDFMSDVQSMMGYDGFDDLFDSVMSASTPNSEPEPKPSEKSHRQTWKRNPRSERKPMDYDWKNEYNEYHELNGQELDLVFGGSRNGTGRTVKLEKALSRNQRRCFCQSKKGVTMQWRWFWNPRTTRTPELNIPINRDSPVSSANKIQVAICSMCHNFSEQIYD